MNKAAQKIEPTAEQNNVLTLDPAGIIADVSKNRRFAGPDPEATAASFYASDEYAGLSANFDAVGVNLPVMVEDLGGGKFRVVEGFTRLHWAKAKRKDDKNFKIKAIVVKFADDRDRVTTGVRLNVARNTFPPLAQARAYKELLALWDNNVKTVAKVVGVSVAAVQHRLSLLDLPSGVVGALESGSITPSAVEAVMKLPGSREYFKTLRDDSVTDAVSAKADAYEKLVTKIVKDLTGRKGVDDAASADDVIDAYNSLSTPLPAARPAKSEQPTKAEKTAPATSVTVLVRAPRRRDVLSFLEKLADGVVDEALSVKRDDAVVLYGIDRIKDLGFANGWAVPEDYESEHYSKEASATVTAEFINGIIAHAVLRKGEAQGYTLADNDKLQTTDGWSAFTRRVVSPLKIIDEIQKQLVEVPKPAKAEKATKTEPAKEGKKTAKAKKKDR